MLVAAFMEKLLGILQRADAGTKYIRESLYRTGKKICVFCLIRREGYQKREDSLLERRSFLGTAVSSVTGSKSIRDETREGE